MDTIVDLKRYPLDQPEPASWRTLVTECKKALAETALFNLEGLFHPSVARDEVARLADNLTHHSFRHEREHTIYFQNSVDGLAADHPALTRFRTSNQTLCADQLGESALTRLYEWPPFATFLAATMNQSALYPMDDPLARINVMSYHAGQALNWHFDRSEFTTTLFSQPPDEGGVFEFHTGLRSDIDPNYDGVARLMQGDDPKVQTLTLFPGTLNVFKGKNTAHRVTEIGGAKDRVIAVFSFYDRTGVSFSDTERLGFYGRAT